MRTTTAALLLLLIFASAPRAATVTIADGDTNDPLAITDVSRRGTAVVGTISNHGADEVRDIRLLVDITFLWANEVAPGEDSPGRAVVTTVPGPLPPNGTIAFEITPNPPLEDRIDGRYADPKVRLMGYTSIGAFTRK